MKDLKKNIILFCCLGLFSACSTTVIDRPDTGNAIEFSSTTTRATIENDFPDGSSFSVWGWYINPEGARNDVFTKTPVTKNGNEWGYEGTQFWIQDNTYNFYAIYPVGAGTVEQDGTIKVENFDCTGKGESAVDLMTAKKVGIIYNETSSSNVELTFKHLLAKVNVVGHSEGGDASIESILLESVKSGGTYTKTESQEEWILNNNSFSPSKADFILTSIPTDIFGNLLLIPQSVDGIKLTIKYSYSGIIDSDTEKPLVNEITYNLPNNYSWEAGKSYRYSFTLIGDYIIFDVPQVNQWNEASGGIIIVD